MTENDYRTDFEKFLNSLQPNLILEWKRIDDQTYTIKGIKPAEYISITLDLCQENQKHS